MFTRRYESYETMYPSIDKEEDYSIMGSVDLSFSARKTLLADDDCVIYDPHYELKSTTSQVIDRSEMPATVKNEILSESDDDEEDDEEEVHVLLVNESDFDDYEIQRQQSVTYLVDSNGEIGTYNLSFSYTLDGNEVYSQDYTTDFEEMMQVPIYLRDTGVVIENRPAIIESLDKPSIKAHVHDIDQQWKDFLQATELREELEFAAQSKREHTKRALSIISLLRSGLF